MEDKGQFFLISAFIIVLIIAGFTASYVEIKAPAEDISVYNLQQEIQYESAQIINFGLYKGLDKEEISSNLQSLVNNYTKDNPGVDVFLVYGNESQSYIVSNFNEVVEFSETDTIATTPQNWEDIKKKCSSKIVVSKSSLCSDKNIKERTTKKLKIKDKSKKIEVWLSEGRYLDFNVNEVGETFYILIKKEGRGGVTVLRG